MREYIGFRARQRSDPNAPTLFVFFAYAKDLHEWVKIESTRQAEKGIQRVLRPARVKSVEKFFRSSGINTIPNNILIGFTRSDCYSLEDIPLDRPVPNLDNVVQRELMPSGELQLARLYIKDDCQPGFALIIDGQHRFEGANAFDDENIPLLVVAIVEASPEERAFQFIVINNKAVRVPADNVKSIVAEHYDESALQKRLKDSAIRTGDVASILADINDMPESPFYKLLKWDHNREAMDADDKALVDLTLVEYSMRSIEDELGKILDDEDSRFEFFITMWNVVKDSYLDIWGHKGNKLMTKVALSVINDFLIGSSLQASALEDDFDITDSGRLSARYTRYFRRIPSAFWTSEWTIMVQDNANVRRLIKDAMQTIILNDKNDKEWFVGLSLLKTTQGADNQPMQ